MKPVTEWDEAYLMSLPEENDDIERKGSRKLDLTSKGVDENHVRDELAKQLSAFANTGGGVIIYGLTRDGTVDNGGVSTQIKSGGTKEWLEGQIPGLTEYEIWGVRVDEFVPKKAESKIAEGKALYVVSVPSSERAPHQSTRDRLYYVRLGSHSVPARHIMIEDIRNRQKHPSVSLDFELANITMERDNTDPDLFSAIVAFNLVLTNDGPLKSSDTYIMLFPQDGSFSPPSHTELAVRLFGIEQGWYGWALARPLLPQSKIRVGTSYRVDTRYIRDPMFKAWWDGTGEFSLEI